MRKRIAERRRPVKLQYGEPDRLVPKAFFRVMTRRYFPVLGLTYAATVVGIAAQKGDFVYYLTKSNTAFVMALFVALWVSVPVVVWVFLRCSHLFAHVANIWYVLTAGMMSMVLASSFILFPEIEKYDLRVYFAASFPIFFIMYYLCVRVMLPATLAHFLSALGFSFLLYGAWVNWMN
jgi:hypothetical protein